MGFLAGITNAIGQNAQQGVNKMLDLRTMGYTHMADLYSKLAENYKDIPGVMGEYMNRAQAFTQAASRPYDRNAAKLANSFGDIGEPITNWVNTFTDQQHRNLTGEGAPKELFVGSGKLPQIGAPGVAPQNAPQTSPQPLGGSNASQGGLASFQALPQAPTAPQQAPQQAMPPAPVQQPQQQTSGPVSQLMAALGQIFPGGPPSSPYIPGTLLQNPMMGIYARTLEASLPELFKPMTVKPGETATIPANWGVGGPEGFRPPIDPGFMNEDQRAAEVASKQLAMRYGLRLDNTKSAISQLPTNVQAEAVTRAKQLQITPEQRENWASMAFSRQALGELSQTRQIDTQQRILEFNTRMKSADSLAHDSVFNPQLLTDPKLDPNTRSFAVASMQKAGMPVPATIPQPLVTQEEFITNALNHGRQILDVIQKYPNVVGAVVGRGVKFDQKTGAPIFSDITFPEGSPERGVAQAVQNSIAYMFTNEVRSAMPGRPAIQYIDILRKASASPVQAVSILKPLVEAMMNAARVAEYGITQKRYGTPRLPLTSDVGKEFVDASGNNAELAKEMAANAGYLIPGYNDPASIQKRVSDIR